METKERMFQFKQFQLQTVYSACAGCLGRFNLILCPEALSYKQTSLDARTLTEGCAWGSGNAGKISGLCEASRRGKSPQSNGFLTQILLSSCNPVGRTFLLLLLCSLSVVMSRILCTE